MSDDTITTHEDENVETEASPTNDTDLSVLDGNKYVGSNPFVRNAVDMLLGHIAAYTDVEAKLAASAGDRSKLVEAWIESPPADNDTATKLREAATIALERLRKLAEQAVPETAEVTEDEAASLKTERATLKDDVKTAYAMANVAITKSTVDNDALKVLHERLKALNPLKGRGAAASGGTRATTYRASVWVKVLDANGQPVNIPDSSKDDKRPDCFKGLSQVAMLLKVSNAEIQEAYAQAAGVERSDIASIDQPQTFELKAKGGSETFTVHTTPKPKPEK